MECAYVRDKFAGYSEEKKQVVLLAIGHAIACPKCKTIHYFNKEDKHEQIKVT